MFRLKKIDKLILSELLPHWIVAFFIAIFILLMQQLWLYIDDIAGKGIGIATIIELFFYLSLVVFPLAIPVAILLSSVMVFGAFAETYQMTIMKASGVSLWRIMRSAVMWMTVLFVFSLALSNWWIPKAQVEFRKIFYEVRTKKPTFALKPKVFNNDFAGYALRVGSKSKDGHLIEDVLLYDMTQGSDNMNMITAQTGSMYMDEVSNQFILQLQDGIFYQDVKRYDVSTNAKKKPFVRMYFDSYKKAFDLSGFNFKEADEEMISQSRITKNAWQLISERDTAKLRSEQDRSLFETVEASHFPMMVNKSELLDTIPNFQNAKRDKLVFSKDLLPSNDTILLLGYPPNDRLTVINEVRKDMQLMKDEAKQYSMRSRMNKIKENLITYEINYRFCLAASCFIFLFIGAPMGAIVRKGGFGYPLIVSIVFFVTFLMLSISMRKLVDDLAIDPVLAAWLPFFILVPIGFYLTYMSMNDRRLGGVSWEGIKRVFSPKKSVQTEAKT